MNIVHQSAEEAGLVQCQREGLQACHTIAERQKFLALEAVATAHENHSILRASSLGSPEELRAGQVLRDAREKVSGIEDRITALAREIRPLA